MEQFGTGFTVTVFVQVDEQPAAVTVVVSVNEPAPPAVTWIELPVAGPTIEPLQEMIVEKLAPPTLDEIEKTLPIDPAQTSAGPSIEQVAWLFTVTVFVQVVEQPAALTVVVSVKEPEAPASTVIEFPVCGPTIVP